MRMCVHMCTCVHMTCIGLHTSKHFIDLYVKMHVMSMLGFTQQALFKAVQIATKGWSPFLVQGLASPVFQMMGPVHPIHYRTPFQLLPCLVWLASLNKNAFQGLSFGALSSDDCPCGSWWRLRSSYAAPPPTLHFSIQTGAWDMCSQVHGADTRIQPSIGVASVLTFTTLAVRRRRKGSDYYNLRKD